MSEDRPPQRESELNDHEVAQPDDAPLHVHTAQLPDGRYCLLFIFGDEDTRE